MIIEKDIKHFHFCCGLGGGKKGFNKATPRVGNMVGKLRCIGGVDVDPAAIRDFDKMGGGRPGTVMDLFTRAQYVAFHGKQPPADWKEVTPADIRRAAGNESPNIVFISSPCKGASGLLSEKLSQTAKYQALNELTLRCIWLMAEAWADDPVELIVFENVPRLATRGRHLLDQINQLLHRYGYAVAETTHDCGELGGLAQSRKRFLLVARHMEKVPPFLYEPEKKRLAAVGDVLGRMPMPGDLAGGPMHRIPRLQWKTWVRLAFVEAGSDWRSLNKLSVNNGHLSDYLIVPEYRSGYLGVQNWFDTSGTVCGKSNATNGAFSIADPRMNTTAEYSQYGVLPWDVASGVISAQSAPGGGKYSVADPRMPQKANRQNGMYRVVKWDGQSGSVTGACHVAGAAMSVADPRRAGPSFGKYAVTKFDEPAGTVIAGSTTGQGAFAVADPRTSMNRKSGDAYLTGGHYGVIPWDSQTGAVSASANLDNGRWSVADPRIATLPAMDEKTIAIIQSLDGTWHRPFTTLELAALQSLVEPEEYLELDGLSDSAWRERIGNAVPPAAAEAIAEVMGTTLLLAWSGETFVLSAMPIWVQPIAVALSVSGQPI